MLSVALGVAWPVLLCVLRTLSRGRYGNADGYKMSLGGKGEESGREREEWPIFVGVREERLPPNFKPLLGLAAFWMSVLCARDEIPPWG